MAKQHLLAHVFCAAIFGLFGAGAVAAADNSRLVKDSNKALSTLYKGSPVAKALGEKATAILVFPKVTKAGLVVGGQTGDGVLFVKGQPSAYYNTSAASFGMQAGAQTFGYTLFFMSDKVLTDFRNSEGFEIGVGPNVVVVDSGTARDLNTLTGKADVFAMIFSQKGLMAGVGVQGSKITRLKR